MDFKCNCGFWVSAEAMDNEAIMEYAIKKHAEDHLAWRIWYTEQIFSGNLEMLS